MTEAQVRRWVTVIPLSVFDRAQEVYELLKETEVSKALTILTMSRAERIAKAIRTAEELGEFEMFYESKQYVGFVRIWINSKSGQEVLDFIHQVQSEGAYDHFPQFRERHGKVKFTALRTPLRYGDPTKTASYLKVEYTK